MNDIVTISHMSVSIAGLTPLSDVSMTIAPGEIVTVVGPNGSGKTTLLRAILGAIKPASGQIMRRRGLRIGYVPQKLHIDASLPMTVRRFLDLPKRQNRRKVDEAISRAGIERVRHQQMSELSGGQFQRVLLARALLEKPDLLILDEATQGLDQPGAAAFYEQIETIRAELNCAILMVSHELHVVMRASDRVICINGHVCCHGTPEIVASDPEYHALFGKDTYGTLALYRHEHDHHHHEHDH